MCDVATIGLCLQVAGTVSSAISSSQQASAYSEYQQLTAQAALDNYISQSKQLNQRYAEEQEASGQERQQIQIENMKAKATAQASAATSGVEGISIDNLFAGYDRDTAVSNYTHARNLELLGYEYNNQMDAYRIQALSTIYSTGSYSGASTASTLLSGLGGILGTYSTSTLQSSAASAGSSGGQAWLSSIGTATYLGL